MTDNPSFPEIKVEILKEIDAIKQYIIDGNKSREELRLVVLRLQDTVTQLHRAVYGNDEVYPRIPGVDDRVMKLEDIEAIRKKNKDTFLKIVGTITITVMSAIVLAVGRFVIEMFKK